MNCEDFQHRLHDYFRGELTPEAVAEVDAHATSCAACAGLMAWARELSCREFTDFLNDYVDQRLPAERRAVFDHHIELCPDCRNYLQSYRATMQRSALALGRQLDAEPEPVPEDLVLAILKAAKARRDE